MVNGGQWTPGYCIHHICVGYCMHIFIFNLTVLMLQTSSPQRQRLTIKYSTFHLHIIHSHTLHYLKQNAEIKSQKPPEPCLTLLWVLRFKCLLTPTLLIPNKPFIFSLIHLFIHSARRRHHDRAIS